LHGVKWLVLLLFLSTDDGRVLDIGREKETRLNQDIRLTGKVTALLKVLENYYHCGLIGWPPKA
jgi:hypothetical protein